MNGFVQVPSYIPYKNALAAAGGAALVSHQRPETGALTRSIQAVIRDAVSILDFCVGDGVADDTSGFTNAVATGKALFWPHGVFTKIDGAVVNTGDIKFYGLGFGDDACGIICATEADWSIKFGTTGNTPRVQLADICIKGETNRCWGIQFASQSLFTRTVNVNFFRLRRALNTNGNHYFSTHTGIRFRDCVEGFSSANGDMDEVTILGGTWHNTTYIYTYLDMVDASNVVVGETLTGDTSADSGEVVAVETNRVIVKKAEGTNGSPASVTFEAAETVTGSTSGAASATISSVSIPRGMSAVSPTGSLTMVGCQNNNTYWYFDDVPSLNIIGGYLESYNIDHPVYDIVNCTGFVTGGVLAGSFAYLDESSYRNINGVVKANNRNSLAPVIVGGGNIFPVPLCDDAAVFQSINGTGANAIDGTSGKLRISGTTVAQYKEFDLPAGAEAVACYITVEAITGDCTVKFQNTDNNSDFTVNNGETKTIRITASKSGGAISVRVKGKSVATWEAEVSEWDVRPVRGIIAVPDLAGMRQTAFVADADVNTVGAIYSQSEMNTNFSNVAADIDELRDALVNAGLMAPT